MDKRKKRKKKDGGNLQSLNEIVEQKKIELGKESTTAEKEVK